MAQTPLVEVAGESDIGLVRERNEDVLLALDLTSEQPYEEGVGRFDLGPKGLLLSVFDGMGGAKAGDRASALASEVLADQLRAASFETTEDLGSVLATALQQANDQIRNESEHDDGLVGMGTTATVATVVDSTLLIAHVGDSRAYLLRSGKLVQLTEDQSLYNELLSSGKMDPAEAAEYEHSNVILQALGVSSFLLPYFARVPLQDGDLLLLCTDGLTSVAPDEAILAMLSAEDQDLTALTGSLTGMARSRGGYDNTTVVLARYRNAKPAAGDDEKGPPQEAQAVQITTFEPPTIINQRRRQRRFRLVGIAVVVLLITLALAGLMVMLGVFQNFG